MLSKRNAIAIAAIAALVVTQQAPARSNPAAAALPAACATGVGCVLVGTVLVGGAVYYIWRNQHTGERYQVPAASPIIDQENLRGWRPRGEVAVAEAELCYRIARRYQARLLDVRPSDGLLPWICVFEFEDED